MLDNIERGCGRVGKERAAIGCEGRVLQELSSSNGEGPDCHSTSAQVIFHFSFICFFCVLRFFKLDFSGEEVAWDFGNIFCVVILLFDESSFRESAAVWSFMYVYSTE